MLVCDNRPSKREFSFAASIQEQSFVANLREGGGGRGALLQIFGNQKPHSLLQGLKKKQSLFQGLETA